MDYQYSYTEMDALLKDILSGKVKQDKEVSADKPSASLLSRVEKSPRPKARPSGLSSLLEYSLGFREDAAKAKQELGVLAPETSPRPKALSEALPKSDVGKRLMVDLQKDFGLTSEQAAGFVGNLHHESGGFTQLQELNPLVPGSRGGGGYAQWTGPRREAFETWATEAGLPLDSYEANYGFLKYELENTSEGNFLGSLRKAQDYQTAANLVSNLFLRPKKETANLTRRGLLAKQYASEIPFMARKGK